MAEITQKLGFEATNAVTQIQAMDTALKGLNTQLGSFNKATAGQNQSKVIQGFDKVAETAGKAEKSVGKVTGKLTELGQKGSKSVQQVTISWGGLVKALTARTAVQAITATIGALKNATNTAAEFQKTIAQISNIADGPSGTIDALTESVSNLSVTLGRDIREVSEAAFEGLQNDLGTTDETMQLLTGAANDLALVTGGTLTQSVNSISSVIKSFGIDISKSSEIADTFFQAIDSGRISLAEFESSLGKVAPLAGVLGVTFEETAASIAAITQAGTTATVAQTQLRNVLQKMLDPTDKLKNAFQQLGFATGRDLIAATGGLIPALQQLSTVAAVGSQEFADFFGTIRGNLGSINLLANNSEIVTGIMGEMAEKAGLAARGARAIDEVDARNVEKSMEELNRTFRDLGESILKVKGFLLNVFNTVISDAGDAKIVLAGLAVTVGVLAIAGGAAAIAFAPVTASIIGIGVAATGAIVLLKGLAEALFFSESASEMAAASLKKFNEERAAVDAAREAKEFEDGLASQLGAIEAFTSEGSKAYNDLASSVKNTQDEIKASIQETFKTLSSDINKIVKGIEKNIDSLGQKAKDARQKASDINQELADNNFENGLINLSKQQKVQARINQLVKERNKLLELSNKADGSKQSDALIKAQESRVKSAQKALDTQSQGNSFNERKAREEATKTIQLRSKAATAESESLAKRQKLLNDDIHTQQLQDLKELSKLTEERSKVGADSQEGKEIDKRFKELQDRASSKLLDDLGAQGQFDSVVARFNSSLESLKVNWDGARESLQKLLNSAPFQARVNLAESTAATTGNEGLTKALEANAASGGDPNEVIKQSIKLEEEFQKKQFAARDEQDKFKLAIGESNNALGATSDRLNDIISNNQTSSRDVTNSVNQIRELLSQFDQLQQTANLDPNQTGLSTRIDELQSSVKAFQESGIIDASIAEIINNGITQLTTLLEQSRALQTSEDTQGTDQEAADSAQRIEEKLREAALIEFGNVDQLVASSNEAESNLGGVSLSASEASQNIGILLGDMQNVATSSGTLSTNAQSAATGTGEIATSMGNVVSQTNSAVGAMNSLASAARAAAAAARQATAAAAATPKYHGGRVNYRANGGRLTRGQDTQLTALSVGETVTNARSSRKFFAELQAINAGQSPQFRDKGGSVTNIGDINVNVSSQSSNPATARNIASELRRELRRQTSIL